jgi:carbon-monoxide dehydrogenase medium subunit
MRLAAPAHLVDINGVDELSYVRCDPGGVRVGALARHAEVEADDAAHAVVPLLRQGLRLVAHPVIRNRGTTVGSLAHADPSGEMTAVLALLGGSVDLSRKGSTRTVAADEFFAGPLESCIEAGELAVSAYFPRPAGRTATQFVESARRHGDYAIVGLAANARSSGKGLADVRLAYFGVGDTPVRAKKAEAALAAGDIDAAVRALDLDPNDDVQATAKTKKHLAGVLLRRVATQLMEARG